MTDSSACGRDHFYDEDWICRTCGNCVSQELESLYAELDRFEPVHTYDPEHVRWTTLYRRKVRP